MFVALCPRNMVELTMSSVRFFLVRSLLLHDPTSFSPSTACFIKGGKLLREHGGTVEVNEIQERTLQAGVISRFRF